MKVEAVYEKARPTEVNLGLTSLEAEVIYIHLRREHDAALADPARHPNESAEIKALREALEPVVCEYREDLRR